MNTLDRDSKIYFILRARNIEPDTDSAARVNLNALSDEVLDEIYLEFIRKSEELMPNPAVRELLDIKN